MMSFCCWSLGGLQNVSILNLSLLTTLSINSKTPTVNDWHCQLHEHTCIVWMVILITKKASFNFLFCSRGMVPPGIVMWQQNQVNCLLWRLNIGLPLVLQQEIIKEESVMQMHFDESAAEDYFWKHCGRRRNLSSHFSFGHNVFNISIIIHYNIYFPLFCLDMFCHLLQICCMWELKS